MNAIVDLCRYLYDKLDSVNFVLSTLWISEKPLTVFHMMFYWENCGGMVLEVVVVIGLNLI